MRPGARARGGGGRGKQLRDGGNSRTNSRRPDRRLLAKASGRMRSTLKIEDDPPSAECAPRGLSARLFNCGTQKERGMAEKFHAGRRLNRCELPDTVSADARRAHPAARRL